MDAPSATLCGARRVHGAITDSLMESYCCPIAVKHAPSWNVT